MTDRYPTLNRPPGSVLLLPVRTAIFAVIIVAWIVLGYRRTNTPVFISTVAMGVAALTATSVTPRALSVEMRRRDGAA